MCCRIYIINRNVGNYCLFFDLVYFVILLVIVIVYCRYRDGYC